MSKLTNQEVADRLDQMDLSEKARAMIASTDFNIFADTFGNASAEDIEWMANEGTEEEDKVMIHSFAELVAVTGCKLKFFSDRFGIPYRTVQDWKSGKGKCPTYVLGMMVEIFQNEGRF